MSPRVRTSVTSTSELCEVTSSEDDKFTPVELCRNSDSPNDHRDQGRDNGVQELEFLCVGRWIPDRIRHLRCTI